jgi:hypothetical protein
MSKSAFLIGAAAAVAAFAGAASAHHAVNAQFDVTQNIAATGVLTRTELINPHSYFHFDVTTGGRKRNISMETGAPAALARAGLSVRDHLKPGTTFKLVYSPSRNGSDTGLLHAMEMPDGKLIGFGGAQNITAARKLLKR